MDQYILKHFGATLCSIATKINVETDVKDLILKHLSSALNNFIDELITDVNMTKEEVKEKCMGVKKEKVKCSGLNSKGGPCRNCALPGSAMCKSHTTKKKEIKKCTGLNSKGGPCRNCARPDTDLCKSHATKVPKKVEKCIGLTSKGGPCRNCALPDSDKCKTHTIKKCDDHNTKGEACRNNALPESEKCKTHTEKVSKPSRSKPKVKQTLSHNHPPGEGSNTCQLCESHGDILNPAISEEEYEITDSQNMSVPERVQTMIKSARWADEEDW